MAVRLCFLICFILPLSAQDGIVTPPITRLTSVSVELRNYLALTTEQDTAILEKQKNYADYERQQRDRQEETRQELLQEYERQPLDPLALGILYIQLSAAEDAIKEGRAKFTAELRTLFTDQQRQKLAALDEIAKMQKMVCESQQAGLLPAPSLPADNALRIGASPAIYGDGLGACRLNLNIMRFTIGGSQLIIGGRAQ